MSVSGETTWMHDETIFLEDGLDTSVQKQRNDISLVVLQQILPGQCVWWSIVYTIPTRRWSHVCETRPPTLGQKAHTVEECFPFACFESSLTSSTFTSWYSSQNIATWTISSWGYWRWHTSDSHDTSSGDKTFRKLLWCTFWWIESVASNLRQWVNGIIVIVMQTKRVHMWLCYWPRSNTYFTMFTQL